MDIDSEYGLNLYLNHAYNLQFIQRLLNELPVAGIPWARLRVG